MLSNRGGWFFIDDIIVKPEFMPEFLPKLNKILSQYPLVYTIAGHVGNGNFQLLNFAREPMISGNAVFAKTHDAARLFAITISTFVNVLAVLHPRFECSELGTFQIFKNILSGFESSQRAGIRAARLNCTFHIDLY